MLSEFFGDCYLEDGMDGLSMEGWNNFWSMAPVSSGRAIKALAGVAKLHVTFELRNPELP